MTLKLFTIIVLCLLPTPAAVADGESYLILEKVPIFCNGGRFLLKTSSGRLHLWCALPGSAAVTIDTATELPGPAFQIVGVTFHEDALEYIAKGVKP